MASSRPDCRNINDRLVSRGLTELTAALAVGRYRIGAVLGIAIQNYIRVRRLRDALEADYTPSVVRRTYGTDLCDVRTKSGPRPVRNRYKFLLKALIY
jgi:hypothetical protein